MILGQFLLVIFSDLIFLLDHTKIVHSGKVIMPISSSDRVWSENYIYERNIFTNRVLNT